MGVQTLFVDTLEEHERDIENMLGGILRTWRAELNEAEEWVYDLLNLPKQVAFRICRDLGTRNELFFLGEMKLAQRLSLDESNREIGRTILRLFQEISHPKGETRLILERIEGEGLAPKGNYLEMES